MKKREIGFFLGGNMNGRSPEDLIKYFDKLLDCLEESRGGSMANGRKQCCAIVNDYVKSAKEIYIKVGP